RALLSDTLPCQACPSYAEGPKRRETPTSDARQYVLEQLAHAPRGGVPGLQHLGVIERRRADTGGEVGDQRDAQHLHARLARGGAARSPAARSVTSERPRTSLPASRAAFASRVVDMPTRSPPRRPAIATSAGVS